MLEGFGLSRSLQWPPSDSAHWSDRWDAGYRRMSLKSNAPWATSGYEICFHQAVLDITDLHQMWTQSQYYHSTWYKPNQQIFRLKIIRSIDWSPYLPSRHGIRTLPIRHAGINRKISLCKSYVIFANNFRDVLGNSLGGGTDVSLCKSFQRRV